MRLLHPMVLNWPELKAIIITRKGRKAGKRESKVKFHNFAECYGLLCLLEPAAIRYSDFTSCKIMVKWIANKNAQCTMHEMYGNKLKWKTVYSRVKEKLPSIAKCACYNKRTKSGKIHIWVKDERECTTRETSAKIL